jgi:hypothetical protein
MTERPEQSQNRQKAGVPVGGYLLAMIFGAIGGAVIVALVMRAFPRMMSRRMGEMMARMQAEGCDPGEM